MTLGGAIIFTLVMATPYLLSREDNTASEVCNTVVCQETARFLLDSMNTSVDPCEDFYQYSCGGWIEKHPIPGDKSFFTETDVLTDEVTNRVAESLKDANNEIHPRAIYDAANLFLGCIDEDSRETEGLEPLKNMLNSLGGWPVGNSTWSPSGYEWQKKEAMLTRLLGLSSVIAVGADIDANHTSQHIITLTQPEFYLRRDEILNLTSDADYQAMAYRDFIISTAKLLNPNVDEVLAKSDAEEMMYFESALSRFTRSEEDKRDGRSSYHKVTVSEVKSLTANANFEWTDFLNDVFKNFPTVTDETEVIFAEIDYIVKALRLAQETNPRVLASYLGWKVLKKLGSQTTKQFRQNEFEFTSLHSGVEEPEKLENTCIQKVSELMEFAVGRLYVDKYFTDDKKRNIEQMVEDIRTAYGFTLMENSWMDDYTKNKTLQKLAAMAVEVGYPPWIKSDRKLNKFYSGFPPVRTDKYFKSLVQITGAMNRKTLGLVVQPMTPDVRDKYWANPTEVNAFYSPQLNSIGFPAGFLDPPNYLYGAPPAINFGAIGATIGHEIGHGFDDQGSQFDAQGNLVDWWSKETKEHFNRKADCFRKQYSSYVEPMTNMHLHANNTIGEDIGDNGAIRNSFIAYKLNQLHSIRKGRKANKRLPGVPLTSDQLFFLGYATTCCEVIRKETMSILIDSDPHSPNEFRVLGPLSNSREFAEAFNCPPRSRMNPEAKCILW